MHGESKNHHFRRSIGATALSAGLLVGSVPLSASALGAGSLSVPAVSTVAVATELSIDWPSRVRTTDNLNMRTGSSTAYSVLKTIPKGTSVAVVGRASNGWYKVSYDGKSGYVSNSYVVAASVRTLDSLNMRGGASTSYRILKTIPTGTTVSAYAKASNGWYKVSYGGSTGWVSGTYVTTYPKPPSAPMSSGPNRTSRVVLTFDDCPSTLSAYKDTINYAASANIGLVIAPIGDCLASYKSRYGVDLASLARAKGQWVINHSISHPDLRPLSCQKVGAQLGGTGVHTNFGRPPYGAVDGSVRCGYNSRGMAPWTWTRDTEDWKVKSKSITIARAAAAAKGDTVLMHMQWYGFSPDSLRQIKAKLDNRGIGVCRTYKGSDGTGAVVRTPVKFPSSLPC
ncbi:SH3 domain-containing protein [Glutamicibacter sp. AOP5-A2-18]|uniref:SH3 domain-containing protein n=1 Tax=Glutamicibacter sp. AOP5-A2-18 TaxID=3457656 RepID=UPI0040348C32